MAHVRFALLAVPLLRWAGAFSLRPEHRPVRQPDGPTAASDSRSRHEVCAPGLSRRDRTDLRCECADGQAARRCAPPAAAAAQAKSNSNSRRLTQSRCASLRSETECSRAPTDWPSPLPPLLWVTVFLLVPYALMFCYSFWSVSPSQTIVHSWNFRQLPRADSSSRLPADAIALHVDRRRAS